MFPIETESSKVGTMKKQVIFDIGEIQCSFMYCIEGVEGIGGYDPHGLFENWFLRKLTSVFHVAFAEGLLPFGKYPDWLVHRVDKIASPTESILFHWFHIPGNLNKVLGIKMEGTDLLIEYQASE